MISYAPFWATLKKKKISTYTLITTYHISSATIDRMRKGNGISTMKIDDFCKILNCNVEDIIEYKEDADIAEQSTKKNT
ncbi:MAG: helix-turn-helix domain-containing protein [Clostridia bacterium]|nr:helix-turn-helix domain-containing protein [Clostridia bacterium]